MCVVDRGKVWKPGKTTNHQQPKMFISRKQNLLNKVNVGYQFPAFYLAVNVCLVLSGGLHTPFISMACNY